MRLAQAELMIMWGSKNSLSLSLPRRIRQSPLLVYVSFYTHRCVPKRKAEKKNKSMWPLFSLPEIAKRECFGTMPSAKVMIESVRLVHLLSFYQPQYVIYILLLFAFPTPPLFQPGAFFHLGPARYG